MMPETLRNTKHWLIAVVALALYLGSYFLLSSKGQYRAVSGLSAHGVIKPKRHDWVPYGFDSNSAFIRTLLYIYYPLYLLDTRLIHNSPSYAN